MQKNLDQFFEEIVKPLMEEKHPGGSRYLGLMLIDSEEEEEQEEEE